MKTTNTILITVFIAFLSTFGLSRCSHLPTKPAPEYKGVDPRVAKLVKEYKELAKIQGITFEKQVTIGFKSINEGNVIGLCTYGDGWREIDIDTKYWNNTRNITHLALLFHELNHCYCDRGHDYGEDQEYPSTEQIRIKQALDWQKNGGVRPGHYDDGCPTSMMYPVVLPEDCVLAHYGDYVVELFNRCDSF